MLSSVRDILSVGLRKWRRSVVLKILTKSTLPDTSASEQDFSKLQSDYRGVPEYGYDDYSLWCRASDRSKQLLQLFPSAAPGHSVLEIGCGDGMTSYLLNCYGHYATCADIEDWRNARVRGLPFFCGQIEIGLPVAGDTYDVVFSHNTFEHVNGPEECLAEMQRMTKPGGVIYLDFGPIYASPWGMHAYRSLLMPYPQFLFSDSFVRTELTRIGIRDLGKTRVELQPMNRWTIAQFHRLWNASGCTVEKLTTYKNDQHLDLVLRYPQSFSGRGLTLSDLTETGIIVQLRKEGKS